MKIIKWVMEHILFLFTLFLLAFIPLYPKLPLVDVRNTWVYVRAEDFVVLFVLLVWVLLLLRKKVTLKTPLTLPILLFWIVGAVSTIHAVVLVFPTLANTFSNVAFLSFLRRIEYMSLFFVAFAGIKEKRFLTYVISTLALTLVLVVAYGLGQKYLGFPAYLTMNEEFAKGIPIHLSQLSRVPSTFGGHYDLAAYLVLVIPILTSMIFAYRSWFVKFFLLGTSLLGVLLLFMTVSRVSFFVLFISLIGVLLFQKRKFILLSLPLVAILLVFLLLRFSPSLSDRFGNTIKTVDVLVDAKTGEVIGQAKVVPSVSFRDRVIKQKHFSTNEQFRGVLVGKEDSFQSSSSAIIPSSLLPEEVIMVMPENTPNGETLPQGTAYINLSLSPVTQSPGKFIYDIPGNPQASGSARTYAFYGDFLLKKATAYDLSFTTRFQGEWPRAIEAFKRNILFGSGYASISLAVDNNYLRILGETGALGFISFFGIFLIAGIYIRKMLPQVASPEVKSFIIGFAAGGVGLGLNAVLIDVFEASKIAYLLWLLIGIVVGTLSLYQTKPVVLYQELKNTLTSRYTVALGLFIVAVLVYAPMVSNHFVGDDFTWFRWVDDCGRNEISRSCPSVAQTVFHYFTVSDGFFYRPGTKVYFLLMYSLFWLNQTVYHSISIFLHFIVAFLVFLLARKILRDFRLCVLTSFLFLIMSGYSESVFWVSTVGFLFNAVFVLLSILFFIAWEEKKKTVYFAASCFSFMMSLFFHELGVITPLFFVLYLATTNEHFSFKVLFRKTHYLLLFFPLVPYFIIRYSAQSHWFSGDYSYNLLKLPFNFAGNIIGYFFLVLFGTESLPFYQMLRNSTREHMLFSSLALAVVFYVFFLAYRFLMERIGKEDRKTIMFGFLFFIIALLPFLGLGNITSRYTYLASVGFMLLFAFLIKKLYISLATYGRDVAVGSVVLVICVFCLFQIIQIQQIHRDWSKAGEEANNFLIAVERFYIEGWRQEPTKLYFVNVPIRVGEAWIFPVGLEDALWFTFRNSNMSVYQAKSVEQALDMTSGAPNERVFEFDKTGTLVEWKKKPLIK